MPQHAHGTVTTEQLGLLTVAGHLDLDRLGQLQQRLDDMPAGGRAVYAMNGIERSPSAALDDRSIVGVFRPGPRQPANQQTRRGVLDTSRQREQGPIMCTGIGDLTVHRRHLRHGRCERRLT